MTKCEGRADRREVMSKRWKQDLVRCEFLVVNCHDAWTPRRKLTRNAYVAQVETLLKDQSGIDDGNHSSQQSFQHMLDMPPEKGIPVFKMEMCNSKGVPPRASMRFPPIPPDFEQALRDGEMGNQAPPPWSAPRSASSGTAAGPDTPESWDLVSMGMEESLPPPQIVEAL